MSPKVLKQEEAAPDLDTKYSAEGAEESNDDLQEETEHTGRDAAMRDNIADESEAIAPLPDGWTEHIDQASGRPYYVNSAENANVVGTSFCCKYRRHRGHCGASNDLSFYGSERN